MRYIGRKKGVNKEEIEKHIEDIFYPKDRRTIVLWTNKYGLGKWNEALEKEFMEQTKEIKNEMTLGEKRCHINFNPSANDKIGTFKRMIADAIDYCNEELMRTEDGEAKRCFSIAMTDLESAQMFAVKGIAKGIKN